MTKVNCSKDDVMVALATNHKVWDFVTEWLDMLQISTYVESALEADLDAFDLYDGVERELNDVIDDLEYVLMHEANKLYHASLNRGDMVDLLGYMLRLTKMGCVIKSVKLENGLSYSPYDIKEIWEIEEVSMHTIWKIYGNKIDCSGNWKLGNAMLEIDD